MIDPGFKIRNSLSLRFLKNLKIRRTTWTRCVEVAYRSWASFQLGNEWWNASDKRDDFTHILHPKRIRTQLKLHCLLPFFIYFVMIECSCICVSLLKVEMRPLYVISCFLLLWNLQYVFCCWCVVGLLLNKINLCILFWCNYLYDVHCMHWLCYRLH